MCLVAVIDADSGVAYAVDADQSADADNDAESDGNEAGTDVNADVGTDANAGDFDTDADNACFRC